jgi:hypothetical protein
MTRTPQSNSSTNIDAANPALLITGCVIVGLMMLAFSPATPIFLALLALAPAMLASEKGGKPLNWYCYGFMLWIVAIIHAAMIPANLENAPAMKRQFWQGVRIGAIVVAVLSIVIFPTIEEGSPARAFLGISAIAGLVMGGVAWTQKI